MAVEPDAPPPSSEGYLQAASTLVERLLDADPGRARALADVVLRAGEATESAQLRARALRTASRAAYRTGDLDRAYEFGQQLRELGEQVADDGISGWGLACQGYVEYERGDHGEALDLCQRAIEAFGVRDPDGDGQPRMLVLAAVIHCRLRLHRSGLLLFREAQELFRALGDQDWLRRLAGNIATALRELGDFEAAVAELDGCEAGQHEIFLDEVRGQLALAAGRLAEARALFSRSLTANAGPGGEARKPEQHVDASVGLARVLLAEGRPAEAAALLAEPLRRAEAVGVPAHLEKLHGCLADIRFALDDHRGAYDHAVRQRRAAATLTDPENVDRVQTVRIRHAVAAARAEADRMRRLSYRDALTELPNRRAVDERLARQDGAMVAVIDIDHFKQVNDRHAHAVGDRVLQRLAELLRAGVAEGDLVARMGGDEFIVVFDPAGAQRAAAVCEALRTTVAEHAWDAIAPGLAVTISVGLGPVRAGTDAPAGVADQRLLEAKRGGRNRVSGR